MKRKRLLALAAIVPLAGATGARTATSSGAQLPASQAAAEVSQAEGAVAARPAGRAGARWAPGSQGTPSVPVAEQQPEAQAPETTLQAPLSEAAGVPTQAAQQEEAQQAPAGQATPEARAKPKAKKRKKGGETEPPEEEQTPPAQMVVGVDSGGWGSSTTFDDLADGGVDYIRTENTDASYVEPESETAGVHIATVVFGTGGSIGAIAPASYAAEVKAYYVKYGLNGGLAVEVLNEPGNHMYWSDPTNYAAYAKLAKAVHEALATLPAASRPVELCSWDGGEASQSPNKPWGQGIKAAGALPYCDGVTAHPYGGKTGGDGGALGGRTDVQLAHSESGKPVYVTEIGWPTAVGQPPTGDSQQWTQAQQAANISSFMQWAAGTGYIPMVIYFNYVDYGTNAFYGIETTARKHKLGFAALAEASARW
jgi:hypothetical protein